jgi:hypothetical protein
MDWLQIGTLIGVNAALFAALAALVVWVVTKLDTDVKAVCSRLDKNDSRFESHSARLDQLYKMFVDLLKDKR